MNHLSYLAHKFQSNYELEALEWRRLISVDLLSLQLLICFRSMLHSMPFATLPFLEALLLFCHEN